MRSAIRPLVSSATRPVQNTHGPQCVPEAGEAVRSFHLEVRRTLVCVLQRPPARHISLGYDQIDRFGAPIVEARAGRSEVVKPAEDVVVPAGREREHRESRVDDLPGRAGPE